MVTPRTSFACAWFILLVPLLWSNLAWGETLWLPEKPAINGTGFFVQDYRGTFRDKQAVLRAIEAAQQAAFENHDVPIIVVTISRMGAYGYMGQDIAPFARAWFDNWEIGTQNRTDGHNRGMLLLVAMDDRKARIELGGDWGHRYDNYCQDVMDKVIVSHFKQGKFAQGIALGVKALGKLAAVGPQGTAPAISRKGSSGSSGFSSLVQGLLSLLVPISIYLFVSVLEWLGLPMGGGGGSSGGYSGGSSGGYSGGGYSGGSSGGGGASGSW